MKINPMKLEDVPNLKGNKYPTRISVSLSSEAKEKLEILKRVKGKDTSELVRILITDFLQGLDFGETA
ncbi:MAG: hypothetical protein NVSMB70_12630 [Chamaesiphon sp.]